jgi:His/Glu/Gln/Arg/opine family amino acid ABC transporter permease subunit
MPVEFDLSSFNLERLKTNYLDFDVVFNNLDAIFQGVLITIALALLAEVLGVVLGLVFALLKISRSRILSWPAQAYIDVFRGTPLLVQITIIYFTTASVGIRFESLFFAGLVALSLNSAAYVAEIFRAGIQSIDKGQMEAGRASGLSHAQTMRYIIVPQAFRRTIPPLDQRVRNRGEGHLPHLGHRARRAPARGAGPAVRDLQRDAPDRGGAHLLGDLPAPNLPGQWPRTPPELGLPRLHGLFAFKPRRRALSLTSS